MPRWRRSTARTTTPGTRRRMVAHLESCAPGLFAWLDRLPHAVRWRDVLFVHGGLPPGRAPEDLGATTDEHLWIRSGFFDTPWDEGEFDVYRAAGIDRVVFGHTPQWAGPTLFHEGHSLDIDTNAVGNPRMPGRGRPGADVARPHRRWRLRARPHRDHPHGRRTGAHAAPQGERES